MSELNFAPGVKVKKVSDTLFGVSINFKDFADWAFNNKNENGYLNLNIAKSKTKDYWYCALNDWTPNKKGDSSTVNFDELPEEKIPF